MVLFPAWVGHDSFHGSDRVHLHGSLIINMQYLQESVTFQHIVISVCYTAKAFVHFVQH